MDEREAGAGGRGSISTFAEELEAKAAILELAGFGGVATDMRKWATELRQKNRLHDFVQGRC